MYVHVSACLYVHHMCAGALRMQKRAVDALERELWLEPPKVDALLWEQKVPSTV